MKKGNIYSSDITTGSLLIPESITIAKLLKNSVSKEEWEQCIRTQNILQRRSPVSARRQARLIRNRLETMPASFLELVLNSSYEVTKQALLAAAIKHSRLLGDFLEQVVRENWRTFKKTLDNKDWEEYLNLCMQREPQIENWTETTCKKLRQVIFRILAEASYIDGTRSKRLLPVTLTAEVKDFLISHNETYVLHCMKAAE